jgi:hypothetical protein
MAGVLGTPDELCGFEKLFPGVPPCDEIDRSQGLFQHCSGPANFARTGLAIGLAEEQRIGVNPFEYGLIAATDTHNATAGAVAETGWFGAVGKRDATPVARLTGPGRNRGTMNNPGGVAAVWAEENSREALFEALRRRETYGTSGPRMTVRFFAGWDYPEDLCGQPDLVERGYAGGVPMGGSLMPAAASGAAPAFVVSALRDSGTGSTPGNLLQRIQIIKVWPGEGGNVHQRVVDVVGHGAAEADVDLDTCEVRGVGSEQLCSVWRDPEFDPKQPVAHSRNRNGRPPAGTASMPRVCRSAPGPPRSGTARPERLELAPEDRLEARAHRARRPSVSQLRTPGELAHAQGEP